MNPNLAKTKKQKVKRPGWYFSYIFDQFHLFSNNPYNNGDRNCRRTEWKGKSKLWKGDEAHGGDHVLERNQNSEKEKEENKGESVNIFR